MPVGACGKYRHSGVVTPVKGNTQIERGGVNPPAGNTQVERGSKGNTWDQVEMGGSAKDRP